jgi:hypothetical protein
LNIASAFDTATAARSIEALDTEFDASGRPESRPHQFRIVVLDTVTALLGPQLSGISSQGNAPRPRPTQLLVLFHPKYRASADDDDDDVARMRFHPSQDTPR